MNIERAVKLTAEDVQEIDCSFEVREEAIPPFDGSTLSDVVPVDSYTKRYPIDTAVLDGTDASQSLLAVARDSNGVAGYIAVSRGWNHCAIIEDFAIDRSQRRSGLGRRLMEEAVSWAREQQLPTLRAETQSNNVPACRFYEAFGFQLGGFDRLLYQSIPGQGRPETALFWYLMLK